MAITSVPTVPQDYRTVYNPIEYVAASNSTAQPNFVYLFDVYDGATLLGRLRIPADSNTYGRADISGICENYLATNIGTIGGATGFTANANSYKEFTVKIGESWTSGGAADQETKTVITYNGSLPNYRGTVVNYVDYQANNYFQNYTVTANTRKFLTNMPRGVRPFNFDTQKVELTDEGWLYFLYDHSGNPITKAVVKTYNGASLVNTFEFTNAITADYNVKIPSAPNTLNDVTLSTGVQPVIPTSGVDNYQIQLYDGGSPASEIFYFQIAAECRYETRRLEFLNSWGGFDCFNFTKVSRRSEDIKRNYYKQQPDDMSSGVITYSLEDRKKVQYHTKSTTKMKLNSDWISVDTFNWLLELIESPEIYLYQGGTRIAIQNIAGNWQEKRSQVDSVFNLEVSLEFSMDNYRQRF